MRSLRQRRRRPPAELLQRLRPWENADPADAEPWHVGERVEGTQVGQTKRRGQGVGDSRIGRVGVGVAHVQGDARADERVGDPALRRRRGDTVHTTQEERVVRDDQVRLELEGFRDHLMDGIDGEQHAFDRRVRVATDQADSVPVGGPPRVVQLLEGLDHLPKRRHLATLARRPGRTDQGRPRWRSAASANRSQS